MSEFVAYSIKQKKRILVAPLHWGLGHATRCIPIIKALIDNEFEPIIASDGVALSLLKKEFPNLETLELPSYNISYPKKGNQIKLKLLKNSFHILKTIKKERRFIEKYIESTKVDGIISDNRFGIRHKSVPSVFITHQLKVLSGNTTWLSSKIHQSIIEKFDECWVPDHKGSYNLSGDLGHTQTKNLNVKYIGSLSRLQKQNIKNAYDIMVLLSGPEPQRTTLEKKLIHELTHKEVSVIFIKGVIEADQYRKEINNITFYNFMTTDELETAINNSAIILARSGYTTIMDLSKLEKKAFFIPTPGQFEQIYLAKKLMKDKIAPFCHQDEFTLDQLKSIDNYNGFTKINYKLDYKDLFSLF
ncbi:glycosyltransferase [Winogradskyella immobilis]|uniref:Glycosyltransferase n=1 Tax=Winogradskyella immobilis TaxID=2816852 RepID=A0ABS8EIL6_9FLAO|nr:glycosyltransferase [Winogradskyella immobilis]MCC1483049.1 glycosyltransferase [Winogradskyella immobilis]MCG0015144.1 glycosyltransferase [Winogradskyella immobilis]